MGTKKEAIARHQENIDFDRNQIETHKKCLLDAECNIKIWRIFKMTDELFLWYEITRNFSLYNKQYARLEGILNKIKQQYGKI